MVYEGMGNILTQIPGAGDGWDILTNREWVLKKLGVGDKNLKTLPVPNRATDKNETT